MNSVTDIVFTEQDIQDHRNRLAPIDARILPRRGNGLPRSGKCSRCGADSGPYATCASCRECGSVGRALNALEEQGLVEKKRDGRRGFLWRAVRRPYVRSAPKIGRNEPCPCGSGKKHKRCCGPEGANHDAPEA